MLRRNGGAEGWHTSPAQGRAAQTQPFVNGEGGYRGYRIPSMLRLHNGELLLFCEARGPEHSADNALWTTDGGPTDIVTRRSSDDGRSWGPLRLVHSETTPSEVVTIGNPAPVALSTHPGTVVLTFCRNNLAVAVMSSTDNGLSWDAPTYIIRADSAAFRKQLAVPAGKNLTHIATASTLLPPFRTAHSFVCPTVRARRGHQRPFSSRQGESSCRPPFATTEA